MTVIDRNNKQNQFYRKQVRLSMKVFKFREFVPKINREKESLTYVTTQFPTWRRRIGRWEHRFSSISWSYERAACGPFLGCHWSWNCARQCCYISCAMWCGKFFYQQHSGKRANSSAVAVLAQSANRLCRYSWFCSHRRPFSPFFCPTVINSFFLSS